jgi:DNA repair exonuclease SbcCD ATPase subunit
MDEIVEVEKTITTLKTKIVEHNTSISHLTKFIQKLEDTIRSLQRNNTSAEREQERLQEHKRELQQLEDAKKAMIEQMQYYETAGMLLKDTGIKTKIIRQYLPIINTLVNKYLASMDFFVNFNLDESFKESIRSRYRDDFSYASFSEGEKQRIDMALMLTWRAIAKLKNSANTNLLILDEIFDSSMDTTGAEELMKILHHLEGTNVFVISHRGDILQDKFSHVIKFSKQQNFSRIVS